MRFLQFHLIIVSAAHAMNIPIINYNNNETFEDIDLDLQKSKAFIACKRNDPELLEESGILDIKDFFRSSDLLDNIVQHDADTCLCKFFAHRNVDSYKFRGSAFRRGCSKNATKCVSFLMKSSFHYCFQGGFHLAIERGHDDLFKLIFSRYQKDLCADFINQLLRTASSSGNVNAVIFLLNQSADPFYKNCGSLFDAFIGSHDEIFFLLIHEVFPDLASKSDSSVVMMRSFIANGLVEIPESLFNSLVFKATALFSENLQGKSQILFQKTLEKISLICEFPDKVKLKCNQKALDAICHLGFVEILEVVIKSKYVQSILQASMLKSLKTNFCSDTRKAQIVQTFTRYCLPDSSALSGYQEMERILKASSCEYYKLLNDKFLITACAAGDANMAMMFLGNGADPTFDEYRCLLEAFKSLDDASFRDLLENIDPINYEYLGVLNSCEEEFQVFCETIINIPTNLFDSLVAKSNDLPISGHVTLIALEEVVGEVRLLMIFSDEFNLEIDQSSIDAIGTSRFSNLSNILMESQFFRGSVLEYVRGALEYGQVNKVLKFVMACSDRDSDEDNRGSLELAIEMGVRVSL